MNTLLETTLILVWLLGFAASDNSTIVDRSIVEDVSEMSNVDNDIEVDPVDQNLVRGDWSAWSKWSACSRSCGGGLSRQQRRCRRKSCKGRLWNTRYKICNNQPCEKASDYRAEQCAAFNEVPYSGQLLKWYPHYDPSRPCALICRGEPTHAARPNDQIRKRQQVEQDTAVGSNGNGPENESAGSNLRVVGERDGDEPIVVLLADKVEDGTKCYPDSNDQVCVDGDCMKVGCDLRVGSNKNSDECGVCGGNGSTCQSRYSWGLQTISACSKACGGGFKIAVAVCKTTDGQENVVEERYCDLSRKPEKSLIPCNTHLCATKWITGEWSKCSTSCGGGSRSRAVFCIEENGNETTKLPEHKCNAMHKPRYQESCNAISCPMWETSEWAKCSVSCGIGTRTRTVECKDGNGRISTDCDPAEKPRTEQECKMKVDCALYDESLAQPLIQPYPAPPVAEKLIDQPMPSESTFITEEWSACSVTCGEGVRHREVHCKIFLEFSRTLAKLPDRECSGPKPSETEKCTMRACAAAESNLSYRVDTVGDDSYAESNLMDSYKNSPGSSVNYEGGMKVAPGFDAQTTFSWKEDGYTPCSESCLGGVQSLIINCVRDDTGKTVTPFLCSEDTKPEARIRTCNDHPCPPRWSYGEFSPCMSPCGIGIQTRDVTCIHEVARGPQNTVTLPNSMCPKPPPADRRYCNVWDCPVEWSVGDWGKCSKTCGGGVKRRKVSCEQIMAQGHKQSREDSECPSQRPAQEKPCNTRACPEVDVNAQPIILGQNATYNQTDLNAKVDLKIGGVASVFPGTAFVKIRCPVKKFDKAQIVWMKDQRKLQRSNKYRISRKGALKIIDITSSDAGLYACVAGHSRAETHIIVKFRSKEQISSEEYLRLGNSVQRNVNLDSAPANSGESLYPDRAAAYGNRFLPIDSEDLSHERAAPSKPTRRPHQKKQRTTTPAPVVEDTAEEDQDHFVTSLHQPGHHESVESTASSGASTLLPHISYLISSLKTFWPFRSDSSLSMKASVASFKSNRGGTVEPKHTTSSHRSHSKYQDIEEDLDIDMDTSFHNTAIPDNTFGPDEERIFIDVDPYEIAADLFGETQQPNVNDDDGDDLIRTVPGTTSPEIDYAEESLKSAKKHWQDTTDIPGRNHRAAVKGQETKSSQGDEQTNVEETNDKGLLKMERKRFQSNPMHNSTDKVPRETTAELVIDDENSTVEYVRENLNHDPSTIFSSSVTSKYGAETTKAANNPENGEIFFEPLDGSNNRQRTKLSAATNETAEAVVDSGHKRLAGIEGKSNDNLRNLSEEGNETNYKETTKEMHRVSNDSTAIEEATFEWVTTEWSKCSQTCGGSGFQMRGAQCTIRTGKTDANSTKRTGEPARRIVDAKLCEDAGQRMPQKVKSCGFGQCPEWHVTDWTACESSKCFNWKTAMQRRDVSCRLGPNPRQLEDGRQGNVTLLDPSQCDDTAKPPQKQECYNDECKGVWRVGEWSQCTGSCEEDGIKYRILQCVWFGTKKPAGNACRDIPRPAVMKTCRGPPCPRSPEECKDQSLLCSRVKMMNMCKVPLYRKQCCETCR